MGLDIKDRGKKNCIIKANKLSRCFKVAERKRNIIKQLLSQKYKIVDAVKNLNFEIERGETVGFIGPNGAGKSTTIKMMSGILVPTEGEIRVLGNIPHEKRKKNAFKIGVVFGQRSQLWWDLPVYDTFILLKNIYKIPENIFERNLNQFNRRLDLRAFYNRPVRQLSLGQRMRADLAVALLHDPEILFLDEPTIGLDIVVKQQIREFICEINKRRNITVILTTHDMKDIEEICKRIIVIDKGSIILDCSVADIKDKFDNESIIAVDFEKVPDCLSIPNVKIISKTDNQWIFSFHKNKISKGQVISNILSNNNVCDISIKEKNIESILRDIYTGKATVFQ